jgi:1,4-dihydroxy-2-naphthoate octaprenyltransferase
MMVNAGRNIKRSIDDVEKFVIIMKSTVLFSRITGALFVLSFLIAIVTNS